MNNETVDKAIVLENHEPLWFKVFGTLLRLIVPLVFLATGLILLYLALPGWSLIIGIPSIVFGIVFLLYTYDELSSQSNIHNND
jgi:hypothetical protein